MVGFKKPIKYLTCHGISRRPFTSDIHHLGRLQNPPSLYKQENALPFHMVYIYIYIENIENIEAF